MREVLYKNLTSLAQRKKDIFLKEVFERDGVIAKTERRCFYFIKEVKQIETEKEFSKWIGMHSEENGTSGRHFYIFKKHDDIHGEDRLICKIAGTFYAVADRCVYTIAFLHSFKVSFVRAQLT